MDKRRNRETRITLIVTNFRRLESIRVNCEIRVYFSSAEFGMRVVGNTRMIVRGGKPADCAASRA